MTDMTDMTAEEIASAACAMTSIDVLTDIVVEAGMASAENVVEGPATALIIAEGVLARVIAAFARTDGQGDRANLDRVVEISAKHVRDLVDHYWTHLHRPDGPHAQPDA